MNPNFIQLLLQPTVLLGICGGLLVWLIILSILYWRAVRHYHRLTKEVKGVDLKEVLEAYLGQAGENKEEITQLRESLIRLRQDGMTHIQQIGLVRFNPFEDTGGDQSFAIALLDEHGSGVVISSLHGREMTRMYGKPVREGEESGYEFSEEEQEAVRKALQ
ncbi:MAG: DUF4446 family protein [Patescibacteria group bacterium]